MGSDLARADHAVHAGESLDAQHRLRPDIESMVSTVGGVLPLRGFDVPSVEDFVHFAAGFLYPLSYDFGLTPARRAAAFTRRPEYPPTSHPAAITDKLHLHRAAA